VKLQNTIVDPQYAQQDWRTTHNYVAQTLRDFTEDVHFVCAMPEDVGGLMTAWMNMEARLASSGQTDAVVAAAFGFVFIHPCEDGNGGIHRFLVHHMLGKRGLTPEGILFPVSAVCRVGL
jgi:Fic family protein